MGVEADFDEVKIIRDNLEFLLQVFKKQKVVAEQLGSTPQSVSDWRLGKKIPDGRAVARIMELANRMAPSVPADRLFLRVVYPDTVHEQTVVCRKSEPGLGQPIVFGTGVAAYSNDGNIPAARIPGQSGVIPLMEKPQHVIIGTLEPFGWPAGVP